MYNNDSVFKKYYYCWNLIHRYFHSQETTGLHHGQGKLIKIVSENDGLSQKAIMQLMNIRAGSLNELISKAIKANLITKTPDPSDHRKTKIFITPYGVKQLTLKKQIMKDIDNEILKPLSDNEKETFNLLLDKIITNLEER